MKQEKGKQRGQKRKQGMCHTLAYPFTLKTYLKAKEELLKLKHFTMQKYNLQTNPLKQTKILQDVITLYLNSSFDKKPKDHISKILI